MNHKVCTLSALIAFNALVATAGASLVFAGGYEKSQTIIQTNECGNYWFPLDVLCSNLSSQIQGDENSVAVAAADHQQDGNAEASEPQNENSEVSKNFAPFP
jgi:hypothetical protein